MGIEIPAAQGIHQIWRSWNNEQLWTPFLEKFKNTWAIKVLIQSHNAWRRLSTVKSRNARSFAI